jgi:hypothetical protein
MLKTCENNSLIGANSLEHKGKFNRPRNLAMILYKELILAILNTSVKKFSHAQYKSNLPEW